MRYNVKENKWEPIPKHPFQVSPKSEEKFGEGISLPKEKQNKEKKCQ